MNIILVRAAESVANAQGRFTGFHHNTDLTDLGRNQALALVKHLAVAFPLYDAIYTSSDKASLQTADILAQGLLLRSPIIEDDFREMHRGIWEGLTRQDVKNQYPDEFNSWLSDPELVQIPEGESVIDVINRVRAAIEKIAIQHATRVIIVTHDISIRSLITQLLRRQIRDLWLYPLQNAAYSVVEWEKHPQVISINITDHLTNIQSDLSMQAL